MGRSRKHWDNLHETVTQQGQQRKQLYPETHIKLPTVLPPQAQRHGEPGQFTGRQHPAVRAPEVCLQRPSQRLLSLETRLVGAAKEGSEITKMNEDGTEPPAG